ncbi:MAG: glycosyltransferase [Prevotellaceae bacterium]|jgi:glycosyltransferase involved in cell wall biosynthesis|nr:glycosyltransferase [Prevotellaceae bacterium]
MAKILHIAAHMGAGAGKAIGGLAVADKANTHSIYLLNTPLKMNHIEFCRANNISVYIGTSLDDLLADCDTAVFSWWNHKSLDELLKQFPECSCKKVVWMHQNGVTSPPLPQMYVDFADVLLITSEFSRQDPRLKVAVLVYGFGKFEPERYVYKTDYRQVGDKFIIGYLGEPGYKKLPRNYLDYCTAVIKRIPNVRFVLAGQGSEELIVDVHSRGLTEYIDFIGWIDDIQKLLVNFDVFGYLLQSNTYATTENTILEAMSAGLPCVISREPLGRYLLKDGDSGFLVSTPDEYAQAMVRLANDESLRRTFGKTAREFVSKKYNLPDNLMRFNAALKGI